MKLILNEVSSVGTSVVGVECRRDRISCGGKQPANLRQCRLCTTYEYDIRIGAGTDRQSVEISTELVCFTSYKLRNISTDRQFVEISTYRSSDGQAIC